MDDLSPFEFFTREASDPDVTVREAAMGKVCGLGAPDHSAISLLKSKGGVSLDRRFF